MLSREKLAGRRDELQSQYDRAHNHARELAGAIAAYDEVIALLEREPEVTSNGLPDDGVLAEVVRGETDGT